MTHQTQRLAASNGRLCFETGRPMKDSNPYRRGTKSHAAFEGAYREAAAKPPHCAGVNRGEVSDYSHRVVASMRSGAENGRNPWCVAVDGEILRTASGRVRTFKTEDRAFEAGDLDAWLRDQ